MLKKLLMAGSLLLAAISVQAQQVLIPAPPRLSATAYILMDAVTGQVLVEHNADTPVEPASLTKLMTGYIVSAEVSQGRISESDMVNISVKAWRKGGSKMFVQEGTLVSVQDLLRGVIVQSGNDASIALAEHVAGSEDAFVDIMNQKAALLGMHNTVFKNSTGWPAEGHITTARDQAIMARAVIYDYPEHYAKYREKYFSYNGINQANRNRLLFRDDTVDGLKTGHTQAAGYCLVSSAMRDGMRLISVVMGTTSEAARAAETQKLLSYGFRYYQTQPVYAAGEELRRSRVWAGQSNELALGVAEDLVLTVPRGSQNSLEAKMHIDDTIKAPISKGQELGNLTIDLNGERLADVPLVAMEAVAEAGFFSRLWSNIKLFFIGLFSF
ncbi:D-alanyl-D-alanine carboxypeptidase family protein [Marinimicrobium sp. ABcell2]|uniref:D-alanyl-D-alanine carboxypeptidase family protein n=1 Tax=Marinimicrobium sp. ABcell2 TaxID=3069751 RepID=UPI0027B63994|nr:D-alanyl-D-alanine carboxypeptidase family protein [Marinimicrobium sp. ABcell2]MDQ2076277.1 D-alanyl-D-alanine carboxypeptidase family protein [Marinimicrobium sp. ABcell2]